MNKIKHFTQKQLLDELHSTDQTSIPLGQELGQTIDYLVSSTPDNLKMLQTLALHYFNNNDLDSAYQIITKILEDNPDNIEALTLKAKLFYTWRSYNDSLEDCNTVLELEPDNEPALILLDQIKTRLHYSMRIYS
jgi:tetratricopeptide (TPR) repeat protein